MDLAPSILGVSPGARFIGVAVMKYGEIVDVKIKPFNGIWSPEKLDRVEAYFTKLIKAYSVKVVVLKVPPAVYITARLADVIKRIKAVAKRNHCEVECFDHHEVKHHFFGKRRTHTRMLVKRIVEITQDFLLEANREQENHSGYYFKMFEAIAVTFVYRAQLT